MDFLISAGIWAVVVLAHVALVILYPIAWVWDRSVLFWYRCRTGYYEDSFLVFLAIPTGVLAAEAIIKISQGKWIFSVALFWILYLVWTFKRYCYARWG